MSRSERLLALLQRLRRRRRPVSGQQLAQEMGISIRTLYRDIASLQQQGAHIEGEPGVGYVLRPGFMLPPMMFSQAEIQALVLGSRWVASRADEPLGQAAQDALAKIAAVLPSSLRDSLDSCALLVGPAKTQASANLDVIRHAIEHEHKLDIHYCDEAGLLSQRIIWPFGLGFFDHMRIVLGWCELRQDFRHFRTDRICAMTPLPARYPRRRQALMTQWRTREGIPAQD